MFNIVIEEVTINVGLGYYVVLALIVIFLQSKKISK